MYTYTHTSEKLPQHIFDLVLRYSYSCLSLCSRSVSNQWQQWANFCTTFSPKSGGVGTRPPCRKKWGDAVPPPHYTPELQQNVVEPLHLPTQQRATRMRYTACV